MKRGRKPGTTKTEPIRICHLYFRPATLYTLESMARNETEKAGKQISRNMLIIRVAADYVAHYEQKMANLETQLTLSEANIDYHTTNRKYVEHRNEEKKKRIMIPFPPALADRLDDITGIETEKQGIFISRTDVIDEALSAYIAKTTKKNPRAL